MHCASAKQLEQSGLLAVYGDLRMRRDHAVYAEGRTQYTAIDELQLTSSVSRQKLWTAKRASFFHSVHALNMKKCGVSGRRDGRA